MGIGLVQGEQNCVPRRPLLVTVPSNKVELVNVLVGAENRLAVPDLVEHVVDVAVLETSARPKS